MPPAVHEHFNSTVGNNNCPTRHTDLSSHSPFDQTSPAHALHPGSRRQTTTTNNNAPNILACKNFFKFLHSSDGSWHAQFFHVAVGLLATTCPSPKHGVTLPPPFHRAPQHRLPPPPDTQPQQLQRLLPKQWCNNTFKTPSSQSSPTGSHPASHQQLGSHPASHQ